MALTNTTIKNLRPKGKMFKVSDAKGLCLEISPKGGKWWRFRYRHLGVEKRLSLGTYPDVSLKDARTKRDEYRKLLAKEVDPARERKERRKTAKEKIKNNFEAIARDWHTKNVTKWTPRYAEHTLRRLERDIFPQSEKCRLWT